MSEITSVIEFKVVSSMEGNVFEYTVDEGSYRFSDTSLSGYMGELALPVQRGDTIELIRDGSSLTEEPLLVGKTGYEGSVGYLQNVPQSLADVFVKERDGAHFLKPCTMQDGDVIRCTIIDDIDYPLAEETFVRKLNLPCSGAVFSPQ